MNGEAFKGPADLARVGEAWAYACLTESDDSHSLVMSFNERAIIEAAPIGKFPLLTSVSLSNSNNIFV
jgi:hypothetical protein